MCAEYELRKLREDVFKGQRQTSTPAETTERPERRRRQAQELDRSEDALVRADSPEHILVVAHSNVTARIVLPMVAHLQVRYFYAEWGSGCHLQR